MGAGARVVAVAVAGACLLPASQDGARADTLNVAADAQTNSRLPNLKSGFDPAMTVCNASVCNLQAGAVFTSFARFDLSALPEGATVDKAVLRLWAGVVVKAGIVNVVRVLDPREEATLNAASTPLVDPTPLASFGVARGDSLHFIDVDITPLVQDWASNPDGNNGLALLPSGGVGGSTTASRADTLVVRSRPSGSTSAQGTRALRSGSTHWSLAVS